MNDPRDHVFHRAPDRPVAVHASGSTITTADGRTFLDGAGGAIASSIGHGRAEVVAAMAAQAGAVEYVHSTQFTTDALDALRRPRVAEVVPLSDARVFPVSGGSEANESAIKLARAYHLAHGETDRHVILARTALVPRQQPRRPRRIPPGIGHGRVRAVVRPDGAGAARQPLPRRTHRRRARGRGRPGDPRHRAAAASPPSSPNR